MIENNFFRVARCDTSHLEQLLQIQEEAFSVLDDQKILRRNTAAMFEECLNWPNITLGVWDENEIAAFAVLYLPHNEEESLAHYMSGVIQPEAKTANFKLCIVRPVYRGHDLQYELGIRIESCARERGIEMLCATVSPQNLYSIHNIERLGYHRYSVLEKYGSERYLYYKIL